MLSTMKRGEGQRTSVGNENKAQETSSTSLGPQGSFFCSLFHFFWLLTNVLGTSYLQEQRNKEENGNTAPTKNGNSKRQ
jgi:hypothetical protein